MRFVTVLERRVLGRCSCLVVKNSSGNQSWQPKVPTAGSRISWLLRLETFVFIFTFSPSRGSLSKHNGARFEPPRFSCVDSPCERVSFLRDIEWMSVLFVLFGVATLMLRLHRVFFACVYHRHSYKRIAVIVILKRQLHRKVKRWPTYCLGKKFHFKLTLISTLHIEAQTSGFWNVSSSIVVVKGNLNFYAISSPFRQPLNLWDTNF